MYPQQASLRTWLILAVICVLIFLLNIDYTAVNLALVAVSRDVDADLNTLQWLLSAYVLSWASCVVAAGRLADIFGKRFILILGIVVFMIGSALTGLGTEAWMLIVGRIIQGVGGALLSSPAYALIFTTTPAKQQGFAMGIVAGVAGLGLAVGPTLAGWILEVLGWQWIFYINLPLGVLTIGGLLILVDQDKPAALESMDWWGAGLLSTGVCAFFYGINQIEVWGFWHPGIFGFLALGGLSLGLFWRRNRQHSHPLVSTVLLKQKAFMFITGTIFLIAYLFSMILVMMGLYLQSSRGYDSATSGTFFLGMTVVIGILSPLSGKLSDHLGLQKPLWLGVIAMICATLLMSTLTLSSTSLMITVALVCAGFGLGLTFPSLNTALFRSVDPVQINTASGIFTMGMMLGNTMGVIASTNLAIMMGRWFMDELLVIANIHLPPDALGVVATSLGRIDHTLDSLPLDLHDQIPTLYNLIQQAFVQGFSWTMMGGASLGCLALGMVFKVFKNLKTAKNTQQALHYGVGL